VHGATILLDLICERFWVPMGPRCKLLTLIAENRCLDFHDCFICGGLIIVRIWLNITVERRVRTVEPSSSGSAVLETNGQDAGGCTAAASAKHHHQESQKKHSMYHDSYSLLCTHNLRGQIFANLKGLEGKRTCRNVRLICLVVITNNGPTSSR